MHEARFGQSAELLGLLFLDGGGNALSSVTVASAAGLDYAVLSAPVPEPASVATFGAGLCLLLALAWRRGRLLPPRGKPPAA
jgi:hypothetical protein